MAGLVSYAWLLLAGFIVGFNGWSVARAPQKLLGWSLLGISLGIFAAAATTYVQMH